MDYFIALFNGFLSFASPCVLPLIPAYLSIISGFSAKDIIEGHTPSKKKLFLYSLFFVFGFSMVFSLIGTFSSITGSFIIKYRYIFEKISGLILFILGLHIAGFLKIQILNVERRKIFKFAKPSYITSFITGMSFAFGWSPCIGPFLAVMLTIAANKSVVEGTLLLMFYSVGMGVPFILVSIFGSFVLRSLSTRKNFVILIEKIAGLVIALLGILIFFDRFSLE